MSMRDRRAFLQISTAHARLAELLDRLLLPVGIAPHLLGLVTHVREHQPLTPTALSAVSGSPPTTLRDNIRRLVELRLVRRVPNPDDARSYLIELTAQGELMARAADPALAAGYDSLERRLARPLEEVQQVLTELNEALADALASEPSLAAPPMRDH
jgi:DNA-binding MarR family transcriptional regulator